MSPRPQTVFFVKCTYVYISIYFPPKTISGNLKRDLLETVRFQMPLSGAAFSKGDRQSVTYGAGETLARHPGLPTLSSLLSAVSSWGWLVEVGCLIFVGSCFLHEIRTARRLFLHQFFFGEYYYVTIYMIM